MLMTNNKFEREKTPINMNWKKQRTYSNERTKGGKSPKKIFYELFCQGEGKMLSYVSFYKGVWRITSMAINNYHILKVCIMKQQFIS